MITDKWGKKYQKNEENKEILVYVEAEHVEGI